MKTRIILTGTGSGEAVYFGQNGKVYNRHHSSALFITESENTKHCLHIDFTLYATDGLVRAKIPASEIDVIAFGHGHEDHCFPFRLLSAKLGIGTVRHLFDPLFSAKKMIIFASKPVLLGLIEMFGNKNYKPHKCTETKRKINCSYQNARNKKEVLFLETVKGGDAIDLTSGVKMKCLSVEHHYDSALSRFIKGKNAFGFVISVENRNQRFNTLYLSDYLNLKPIDKFKKNIKGYPLDLCILGMPVPFSENDKNKSGKGHMRLEETLSFFSSLKKDGFLKTDATIVLTHLSDRWDIKETLEKAKNIIPKYWDPKHLWIPQKDDFQIIHNEGQLTKKGNII